MKTLPYSLLLLLLHTISFTSFSQKPNVKDSVVYKFTYRDTIIYRYDTVYIKTQIHSDTLHSATTVSLKKKRAFNPNSWGIGPTVGAYYSVFNGFDLNIGFGVQYYLFAVPGFRNPHMKQKRGKR